MNPTFRRIERVLLLSKFDLFCRRMTSSMRGCCHLPVGVETAGEACCCGVVFAMISFDWGVRLSFGRWAVDIADGEGSLDCGLGAVRLLLEDEERTRAVVDIVGNFSV